MKSFRDHLKKANDLVTTYEETRAGFIAIALEKNKHASPYIEEAKILKSRIKSINNPDDLLKLEGIRSGLIAAAGISDKATVHLGEEGCNEAIKEFIKNFLKPSGRNFKDELIFRFLLTKGDSLGGSMRNIVGAFAQRRLSASIFAALRLSKKDFLWYHNDSDKWIPSQKRRDAIEDAKGIFWYNNKKESRTLFYNITVPIVQNNIDIIVLKCDYRKPLKDIISQPTEFIALGELKGGIDPAGADEHWKTAKTAIDRIVTAFTKHKHNPYIFYIGAAIENKMASEIWDNLENNYITNAANLTKSDHVTSLTEWILDI